MIENGLFPSCSLFLCFFSLPIHPSIHPLVYLSIYLSIYLSFSVCQGCLAQSVEGKALNLKIEGSSPPCTRSQWKSWGGFGLLSGQNGPPEGEQGAQPSRPSWRGPFRSIWAAERPNWTIRGRARSLAKLTKLARSVLEDLGC